MPGASCVREFHGAADEELANGASPLENELKTRSRSTMEEATRKVKVRRMNDMHRVRRPAMTSYQITRSVVRTNIPSTRIRFST